MIRTENNRLAKGYNIKLYLNVGGKEKLLGKGTTDEKGLYTISYTLPNAPKGVLQSIFIRVYDQSGQLKTESPAVNNPRAKVKLDFQLLPAPVEPMARATAFFGKTVTVEGDVTDVGGEPVGAVRVALYRVEFGKKTAQLAVAATNDDGRYTLSYTPTGINIGLAVQVKALSANNTPLAVSPVQYRVSGALRIDLRLPDPDAGKAWYERWEERLRQENPAWYNLPPAEQNELARRSGEPARRVMRLSAARQLSAQSKAPADLHYAWIEKGLPSDLDRLAILPADVLKSALEEAAAEGVIAPGNWDTGIVMLKDLNVSQPAALLTPDNLYQTPDKVKASGRPAIQRALDRHLREQVLEAVGGVSAGLYELAETAAQQLDYSSWLTRPFSDAVRQILEQAADDDPDYQKEAGDFLVSRAPSGAKVAEVLQLDLPVQQHPALYEPLQRGAVFAFSGLAGITGNTVPLRLLERQLMVDDWNETGLEPLVQEKILTVAQQKSLSRVAMLARLSGQNLPLMQKLMTPVYADPKLLAQMNASEWEQFLTKEKIPTPPGHDVKSYSNRLNDGVGQMFPSALLTNRTMRANNQSTILNPLKKTEQLFKNNTQLLDGRSVASLDWSGISPTLRATIEPELSQLSGLANTFRALGMEALVNDGQMKTPDKVKAIRERLDWLDTFQKNNPDFDLLTAQLSNKAGAGYNWAGIPSSGKNAVRQQLAAQQRVLLLSDRPEQALKLMSKGYDSAQTVAREPKAVFVQNSELSPGEAEAIHGRARAAASRATQSFGAIQDALSGGFQHLRVSNLPSGILRNELKAIEGLDAIFGPQNFCACFECRSALSPAAYLVDMMRFVEQRITKTAFSPSNTPNNIQLPARRPDLWTLELSCDHTKEEIAYLQVVNRVMENWLQTKTPENIYERISRSDASESFSFPYHLPQAELRLYLGHFGVALHDLYRVIQRDTNDVLRERLQISRELLNVITAANTSGILERFRVKALKDLDVKAFLAASGLTRAELDELLKLASIPDINKITISREELFEQQNSVGFRETFNGLSNSRLDYLHRFLRLWKSTGWTLKQFDDLLLALGAGNTLNTANVLAVARTHALMEQLAIGPEEMAKVLRDEWLPRVALSLGWTVTELEHELALLAPLPSGRLEQMERVVAFAEWQKGLPFSPAQLRFALEGAPVEVYAYRVDVEAILKLEAEKREKRLHETLFALFNLSLERLDILKTWTPISFTDSNVQKALTLKSPSAAQKTALINWVQSLERLLWVFGSFGWRAKDAAWVAQNPGKLGIGNPRQWNLAWWEALAAFHRLLPVEETNAQIFTAVLESPDLDLARLAALWGEEAVLLQSVATALNITKGTPQNLLVLQKTLPWCKRLGVDGAQLRQLTDDRSFQTIESAGKLALGLFATKYPADAERKKQLNPYQDQVSGLRRDALTNYLLGRQAFNFNTLSDIYAYFLLDPEMDPCFKTSEIVSAHGSLQLYVHRVLMNLEQSGNFSVLDNIPVATLDELKAEWEWRKNYRVWEANRKVFLYPENYLEPDLRDNKTPIFRELEEDLLQQELNQKTAETAFRNYFSKYDELANLYIAGSFYHPETNTYYFFGRTRKSPYQYYFRKWENQRVWTAWEKMEINISVKAVTGTMFKGQLFVFWVETENSKLYVSYTILQSNGRWITPQRIDLSYNLIINNQIPDLIQIFPDTIGDSSLLLVLQTNIGLKGWELVVGENQTITCKVSVGSSSNMPSPKLVTDAIILNRVTSAGVPLIRLKPIGEGGSSNGDSSMIGSGMALALILNDKPRHDCEIDFSQQVEQFENNFPSQNISTNIGSGIHYLDKVSNRPGDSILQIANNNQGYLLQLRNFSIISGQVTPPPVNTRGAYYAAASTQQRKFYQMVRLSTAPEQDLSKILFDGGIETFLGANTQAIPESKFPAQITNLLLLAPPQRAVAKADFTGPYGDYYRELFFHIPFLMAQQFNANQKFKEAKWWYERIFDPTASGVANEPDRPWRYLEFQGLGIQKMKETLADEVALERYRRDPFNPHAIARLRLSAYQKTIVTKYVDNLLDWGDYLFNQYNRESINEAMMLYVLAADILGPQPTAAGDCKMADDQTLTYDNILERAKEIGDFLIELENWNLENTPETPEYEPVAPPDTATDPATGLTGTLAFCIPENKDLLEYWKRVSDRLYKIRHCLDINGQRRMLPLYQPPIDPMLLVRAKAMGLSLDQVLDMVYGDIPPYRFVFLLERARQYAQTVQAFGSALLSALNSKDAEELTLLRSVQEREILRMGREMKRKSVEEARFSLRSVEESRINLDKRDKYFSNLVKTGLIPSEQSQQNLKNISSFFNQYASELHIMASVAAFFDPNGSLDSLGNAFDSLGRFVGISSELSGDFANFQRRAQDWAFQQETASQELKQLNQQLLAAEIRVSLAEKDLEMHDRGKEHADELFDFYRNKFTNLGMFNYLSRTLHNLHRQAYEMAYEAALMAQKAYTHERDESILFIQPNNWQSDRAGLLSGERLLLQLQEMEHSFQKQNTRDLELTKHISLQQLDPLALLKLRENGICVFSLPEELFDLDFPGHFRRRIKSVSMTIPCIAGPYTTINCTLSMIASLYRVNAGDTSLSPAPLATQNAIAVSSAQGDSGLFELNFRDERYLPFEGAGAASDWKIELTQDKALRQFDYNTIADVILHLRYTAKSDEALKTRKIADLKTMKNDLGGLPLMRLFSLRYDFPNEWHAWTTKPNQDLGIPLKKHHFPYFAQMSEQLSIKPISSYEKGKTEASTPGFTIDDNWIIKAPIGDEAKQVEDWFILVQYTL
ncbi:MAG: hypothetical protein IPN20_21820 [Haliscomenobacter sp.]|nr:hypothetical protein [Haliscomenobacter sp.]